MSVTSYRRMSDVDDGTYVDEIVSAFRQLGVSAMYTYVGVLVVCVCQCEQSAMGIARNCTTLQRVRIQYTTSVVEALRDPGAMCLLVNNTQNVRIHAQHTRARAHGLMNMNNTPNTYVVLCVDRTIRSALISTLGLYDSRRV